MKNIEKVNVKYLANALNLKNLAKVKSDLKPERIFANMNKKKTRTKTTRRMKTFKTKTNNPTNERRNERMEGKSNKWKWKIIEWFFNCSIFRFLVQWFEP